jgi:small ligand-binding sensory domain FIST
MTISLLIPKRLTGLSGIGAMKFPQVGQPRGGLAPLRAGAHIPRMLWASAISTAADAAEAVSEAVEQVAAQLGSRRPHLVFAFATQAFAAEHASVQARVRAEWGEALLFGCCASGVIGAGREIEDAGAVSVTAAWLPNVRLTPLHLESQALPPIYAERIAWQTALNLRDAPDPQFIIVSDPFSFDAEDLVRGLDRAFPASTKIGGLASGGREAGENLLMLGERTYRSGAIVLALSGNVRIDSVVAQGCRPIGDPMFVTNCHGNLLRELDGKVPRDVLSELYERLNQRDQELVGRSLFVGLAMPGERPRIQAGEFLIRNVLGMDPQSGALWVGAELEANGIVQFHVRDALSSAQDLERALLAFESDRKAAAALLFSCIGRGVGLYGSADHDSNALKRRLGEVPIGGFFCNGEIGAVQGMTQVHGYTSAVAIVSSPRA